MQTAIDFVARCLSGSALAALGGIKFVKVTSEEYENIEPKDENTIYIVTDTNKIILYLGEYKLNSGVMISGLAKLKSKNVNRNIYGNATYRDIGGDR